MDHYAVLGLPPGAPIEEVRAQFRRLARVFHPDRNSDDAWCQEQLKRLNASYEFLADAERKAKYDATLLQNAAPKRPAIASGVASAVLPNSMQRLVLTALFCAALIGAVVIGILIGFGQTADSPFSAPVTAAAPIGAAVSPLAAEPSSDSDQGMDETGSPKDGSVWPASPPNNGDSTMGGQARAANPAPPLSSIPTPVPTGYWPPAAPVNSAPAGP